jgi:chaperonin GroEL
MKNSETVLTGEDARVKLLQGVNKVANAVKPTLGGNSHTVIIEREDTFPLIVNDGVSIARAVNDPDPFVQMGISLIQQVATQAQNDSGDGTTTATVLAQAMCNEGMRLVSEGEDPFVITRDLEKDMEDIVTNLKEMSYSITEKKQAHQIAIIASNNDEGLGTLIGDIMWNVGSEGAIALKTASSYETISEHTKGLEINGNIVSPHFPTTLNNANVFLTLDKINTFESLIPMMEMSAEEKRPLLIICSDYNPSILPNLLLNVVQGRIDASIVKLAGMSESQRAWSEDIKAVVGGKIFENVLGTDIEDWEDLGYVESFNNMVIENNERDSEIEDWVGELQTKRDEAETSWDKQTYARRIARLLQGVASISVGAHTEVELLDRKERVDDAVNAVRAALRNGYVEGGGSSLFHLSKQSKNPIIKHALEQPMNIISRGNSKNFSGQSYHGWDAKNNKWCNMVEAGIIDPTDVVINSLRSAVSVAKLVLLSDAMVSLPR